MGRKPLKFPDSFIFWPGQVILVSNPMFSGSMNPCLNCTVMITYLWNTWFCEITVRFYLCLGWAKCHPAHNDWKVSAKSFSWTFAGGLMSQSPGCVRAAGGWVTVWVTGEPSWRDVLIHGIERNNFGECCSIRYAEPNRGKVDTKRVDLSTKSKTSCG